MSSNIARSSFSAFMPAFVLVGTLIAMLWLAYRPVPGQAVAVLFSPIAGREAGFRTAFGLDTEILGQGRVTGLVVLAGRPGLNDRLADAGAWLVLRASGGFGCISSFTESRS